MFFSCNSILILNFRKCKNFPLGPLKKYLLAWLYDSTHNNKLCDVPSNGTIEPVIYYSGYGVINFLDLLDQLQCPDHRKSRSDLKLGIE